MKTKIYISLLALAVAFVSCDNDLEAPTVSSLDAQSVFTQYDLAQNTILGIYVSFGETNAHRGRYIPYYGLNTDVEVWNGMKASALPGDDAKTDIAKYACSVTNDQLNTDNNAYAKMYEGIERANMAIEGLREFGDLDDPDMAQFLGEALTLRAVYYLDLIKAWGDVPMRFESITTETMYMPREDHDLIYQQLLEDLKEAGELCYWPNENSVTSTVERVSAAFAKALRARVALYAAGYSLRQDGTIRKSNILDPNEMYQIVRDECIDIIEHASNTLGSFYDTFYALSTDGIAAGNESLWEIPFATERGRVGWNIGVGHYADQHFLGTSGTSMRGGDHGPSPFLYYDYDVDDVRRDITCVPYNYGKTANDGDFAQQELESIHNWSFGKVRYEWLSSIRIVTNANDDGINWPYMRLADVYLMAAEAINELSGPGEAAQYLRPVLERALPSEKVETYMSQYSGGKDAFFNGIVEQRKLEFAGESIRKADLIRWNLLKAKLDEAREKTIRLANQEGEYEDLPRCLYYKYASDNESLIIYGLNHGDTDDVGAELVDTEGYTKYPSGSGSWIGTLMSSGELAGYENFYFDSVDPDYQQYWPIFQYFIDTSNNMLDNAWLGK